MITKITVGEGWTICEHCGRSIKNQMIISFVDGSKKIVGTSCVYKYYNTTADKDVLKLFEKRVKQLAKYKDWLNCLKMEKPPVGKEYFGSGLHFIADSKGNDIFIKRELIPDRKGGDHWIFYPMVINEEKNQCSNYPNNLEEYKTRQKEKIQESIKEVEVIIDDLEKRIKILFTKYFNTEEIQNLKLNT